MNNLLEVKNLKVYFPVKHGLFSRVKGYVKAVDDVSLDVIKQRMKTYEKETKPLLSYYGKRLVHRINADQTPAKVLVDILKHVVKV